MKSILFATWFKTVVLNVLLCSSNLLKRAIENIDVIIIIGKIAIGRLTARTLVFMDIFTMQKLLNLFIYKLNIFSHLSIH